MEANQSSNCNNTVQHVKWAVADVTYDRPDGWTSANRAGIDGAAIDISDKSVFTWRLQTTGATVLWADLKNPDPSIAGAASPKYGLDCVLDDADLWINSTHINASPHTVENRQCIAIHEFGHAMQFSDVSSGSTVMLQPHSTRCQA